MGVLGLCVLWFFDHWLFYPSSTFWRCGRTFLHISLKTKTRSDFWTALYLYSYYIFPQKSLIEHESCADITDIQHYSEIWIHWHWLNVMFRASPAHRLHLTLSDAVKWTPWCFIHVPVGGDLHSWSTPACCTPTVNLPHHWAVMQTLPSPPPLYVE